uniref:Sulfhydryl oxidase n=1 Tax=Pyramimonas obovata TaxID=1411642 RepID=A0A7S0WFK3_9CHLO|mmetsp:Transcript_2423/g.4957  ORF Transcript_2423/g.4957 Transcript_2423/m.4957 type:complete len:504 (+) Transcript_2423:192-1703(+)
MTVDPLSFRWLLPVILLASLTLVSSEKAAFTIELTTENFNQTLSGIPSSAFALIEFFAPWCPHCQRFKPQYEKVAALFNTEPRTTPDIMVFNVDCVAQGELCTRYDVKAYPAILFGPPKSFETNGQGAQKLNNANTADDVMKFINNRLGQNFVLSTDTTYGNTYNSLGEQLKPLENLTASMQVSLADVEKATVLSYEYMFSSKLLVPHNRRAFVQWTTLLANNHPVPRCRAGCRHLLSSLEEVWPERNSSGSPPPGPLPALQRWRVCGRHRTDGDWQGCKGSAPTTRGYSCGLWSLFHTLSASAEESEADAGFKWMQGVKAFVGTFFTCQVCNTHFMAMASTADAARVSTRKDAVLWMWQAHNQVNLRLAKEEAATDTGDPAFPKMQWPSPASCPPCRTTEVLHMDQASQDGADWNMDAMYEYLLWYYGEGKRPAGVALPARDPRPGPAVAVAAGHPRWGGAGQVSHVLLMAASGVGLVVCAYVWLRSMRNSLAKNKKGLLPP